MKTPRQLGSPSDHRLEKGSRIRREPEWARRADSASSADVPAGAVLTLQPAMGNRAVVCALRDPPSVTMRSTPAVRRFLVYRAGSSTENNMTPKEKDTAGNKRGLSTFEDPKKAPISIDKAQEIQTDNLQAPLVAVRNGNSPRDTHVSIRPQTGAAALDQVSLENWAARKDPEFPALTNNVIRALTGNVWRS
jgi:hypothetical protein